METGGQGHFMGITGWVLLPACLLGNSDIACLRSNSDIACLRCNSGIACLHGNSDIAYIHSNSGIAYLHGNSDMVHCFVAVYVFCRSVGGDTAEMVITIDFGSVFVER